MGHESLNFTFAARGALFDGACMARAELPDYPIRAIEVGQWIPGGETLWNARTETPEAYRKRYAEVESGEPLVRADFDVYLRDGALHWLKSPCAEDDTRGRFLLSAFPRNPEDMPAEFRGLGHEILNFTFVNQGERLDGACMARVDLPDYPIRAIEVGQWIPGRRNALVRARRHAALTAWDDCGGACSRPRGRGRPARKAALTRGALSHKGLAGAAILSESGFAGL